MTTSKAVRPMKKGKAKPRCKHEIGWVSVEPVHVYVTGKGQLVLDGQWGKDAKIRMRCNRLDCDAERNIYIPQKFGVGYGRVHMRSDR